MIVTNASERTQYFHFPVFVKTDKPSYTDWNNTFEELDGILESMKLKINTLEMSDGKLSNDMQKLQEKMLELQSTVTDYTYFFNDLKKAFAELQENQIALAAQVKQIINADLPAKYLQVESEIRGLDQRVTALENE